MLTTPYPPNPQKLGGAGAGGLAGGGVHAAMGWFNTAKGGDQTSIAASAKQNVQERRGSPKRVVLGNDENKLLFALPEGPVPLTDSKHGNGRLMGGGGSKNGSGVLRTIYLPNETADTLKLMIQSLRTQLEEQHLLHEQRCQALLEDRLIREAECKERDAKYKTEIDQLRKDLMEMTDAHTYTTKDYLDLRHKSQTNERTLKYE